MSSQESSLNSTEIFRRESERWGWGVPRRGRSGRDFSEIGIHDPKKKNICFIVEICVYGLKEIQRGSEFQWHLKEELEESIPHATFNSNKVFSENIK